MTMARRIAVILPGISLALLSWTAAARACPVCFGNKDSELTQGAAAGVLFMVILTYAMLILGFGGVLTFFVVRSRRLRRSEQRAEGAPPVAAGESAAQAPHG